MTFFQLCNLIYEIISYDKLNIRLKKEWALTTAKRVRKVMGKISNI